MTSPCDHYRYSIIIPHYNSAKTLMRLLESITTKADIQIIIVDDNSSTDMGEAGDYIKNRLQCEFYVNETGIQSAGACRNIGLSHAKGEWILFADADDYFVEGFIGVIDRWYDSGHDFIMFVPTSADEIGGELSDRHIRYEKLIREYQESPNRQNELNLRYRFDPPWSKMIRRRYLEAHQIGFETVPAANDVMFSARLSYHAASFGVADETIYVVTKSRTSLKHAPGVEQFLLRKEAFVRQYRFLRQNMKRDDWKLLGLSGDPYLYTILRKGYGWDVLRATYIGFRTNQIRLTWRNSNMIIIGLRSLWYRVKGKVRPGIVVFD